MKRLIPTKPFEALCSALYFAWGMSFILDPTTLKLSLYMGFAWNNTTYSCIFFSLFLASLTYLIPNPIAKYTSGYVMLCGSFMWFVIAIKFMLAYPPLSPEIFTFLIIAVACLIRGIQTIEDSRVNLQTTKVL